MIEERQKIDELAQKISVVEIIKIIETEKHYEKPWYEPYRIIPCPPCPSYPNPSVTWANDSSLFTGSDFYHTTAGTYDINGSIFNL